MIYSQERTYLRLSKRTMLHVNVNSSGFKSNEGNKDASGISLVPCCECCKDETAASK